VLRIRPLLLPGNQASINKPGGGWRRVRRCL